MDNDEMKRIRRNLAELPVLQQRAENSGEQIAEAEKIEEKLKRKYESESHDVEKLMKQSFTVMLLEHIGRYEGKLSKENREKLEAKLEYDKACDNLQRLRSEYDELTGRIKSLQNDSTDFEEELRKRREQIKEYLSAEAYERYSEIDSQIKYLTGQLAENREALEAANRALSTAQSAVECLDRAEGWATYDAWTRGGIISHAAKYDNFDEAKSYMNKLEMQLKDLNRELSDVNLCIKSDIIEIDSTTRMIDFWFDNIFTDLNVRSIISDNKEQLVCLCEQVNKTTDSLEHNINEVETKINELEKTEEDMIVG